METEEIINLLNELAVIKAEQEVQQNVYNARSRELLIELDAEFQPLLTDLQTRFTALRSEIEEAILAHGKSVKGGKLQAVYSKGRTTWDGKLLEGLALAFPQLENARKVGQPSVSIREV